MKNRILILTESHPKITAIGHVDRIIQGLFETWQSLFHFLAGFEVKLILGELKAFWIIDRLPGLDAKKNIVGFSILLVQVMAIIGGDQREGEVF